MQDFKSNITMEAMDAEFSTSSNVQRVKESVFDEKNYLNIRLDGNQTSKELKIRLLPIDSTSQTPFKKIHLHTLKVPKEISQSGWKSYICLEKTDGIDNEKYGNKCPFCELNREAYKRFTEETDPNLKERWKKISLDNMPKEGCIVRCIERGAEEDGPKFWKFNTRRDKGDPKGQIMELYKTRLEESREEGLDDENILDIKTGKDLKVTISLAAEDKDGKSRTSVKVVDYGKSKPLSTDDAQILAWINDSKKWSDVFAIKPYDYLKIILDGEIPFFDKGLNKWVTNRDKDEAVKEAEEEMNSKIHDATLFNANTDYVDDISITVENAEDDGLPF